MDVNNSGALDIGEFDLMNKALAKAYSDLKGTPIVDDLSTHTVAKRMLKSMDKDVDEHVTC